MQRVVIAQLLALLFLGSLTGGQGPSGKKQDRRIAQLINALHRQPWRGPTNICSPRCWQFNFTEPMKALLKIGPDAQQPLLTVLPNRPDITDQVIMLLGGVGDERSVGPIIKAMKLASTDPSSRREKVLLAGNLALTNITVAEVIYNQGDGIPVDACPDDPAACWAAWWRDHQATFHVKDIKESRNYVNYPNYGIYHHLP